MHYHSNKHTVENICLALYHTERLSRKRQGAAGSNIYAHWSNGFSGLASEALPPLENDGIEGRKFGRGSGAFDLPHKFVADGEESVEVHRFRKIDFRPGVEDYFFGMA